MCVSERVERWEVRKKRRDCWADILVERFHVSGDVKSMVVSPSREEETD